MTSTVKLTRPEGSGRMTLEDAIGMRRTARDFSTTALTLDEIARLLWAAQGVTGESGQRAVPSAGAEYPLALYLTAGSVAELSVGLYAYDVDEHALRFVLAEDFRHALYEAALDDQPWIRDAPAIMLVAADLVSIGKHFEAQPPRGERGARYAYMETGALAENVYLQGTALGLSTVLVGGFDDARVKSLLRLSPAFEPTALICLGR